MIGQMAIPIALIGFNNLGRSFQKQILFTIISTLSKNEQKIDVGSYKKFKISVHGHEIVPSCGCKARETMIAKCELVL